MKVHFCFRPFVPGSNLRQVSAVKFPDQKKGWKAVLNLEKVQSAMRKFLLLLQVKQR